LLLLGCQASSLPLSGYTSAAYLVTLGEPVGSALLQGVGFVMLLLGIHLAARGEGRWAGQETGQPQADAGRRSLPSSITARRSGNLIWVNPGTRLTR